MWHQNAAEDSDELLDVISRAVLTPGYGDTLGDRQRVRLHDEVLVSEGDGHHSDQETEEQFQSSETVLIEKQEGEGVENCNQNAGPDWQKPVGEHVQSDSGTCGGD